MALCEGCRQKLGTVVETVVSAADDADSTRAGEDRASGAAESASNEDPLRDDGWVDAGELQSRDDASGDEDAAEVGSDDVTYTTSTAAGGRKSVSGNAESIGDDREPTGENDGAGAGENDDETASGHDTASDDTGGDGSDADDRPSMSALENTKVMRLLQNREFPVDREEIRAVATNAYDLEESQFDAVVDAAVDRGLIGEEDGQFVEGS
jgi:hypothetical protein